MKLDSNIAVAVAIAASMMAIFNIKDNNIVQAMSQAQAHSIDAWSYYQSKGTKLHMAENTKAQLELILLTQTQISKPAKEKVEKLISENSEKIKKYESEKIEIKSQAEGFQKEYDELNIHDDQFDLAEALLSLALSIFGITALIQNKRLFYFALCLGSTGLFFGIAGFLNLSIHPDFLAKLLG